MTSNIIQLTFNIIQLKLLANKPLLNFFLLTLSFCFLLGQKFRINLFKIVYLFLEKAFDFILLHIKVFKLFVNPFNICNFVTFSPYHFCFEQTFLRKFILQALITFLNRIFIGLNFFNLRLQLLLFS